MKRERLELLLKKELKRKIKITLGVLVMFLINGSVSYTNVSSVTSVKVSNTGKINNIDQLAYTDVGGLYIMKGAEDEIEVEIDGSKYRCSKYFKSSECYGNKKWCYWNCN